MRLALGRLLLAGVCCLTAASDVLACVCGGRTSEAPSAAELRRKLRNELSNSLAVFVGEPIAGNSLTVRMRVESVWKGDVGPEVVMSTGAEATPDGLIRSSSCDVRFAFGHVYLIFGDGKTLETMKAHHCSFTGLARDNPWLKLLDGLVERRPPSGSLPPRRLVAVVGSVRNPGVVEWREGLTVADAVTLAGGSVPPLRPEFAQYRLTSVVVRWRRAVREVHPALPTTPLLPDDELFVAGEMIAGDPDGAPAAGAHAQERSSPANRSLRREAAR